MMSFILYCLLGLALGGAGITVIDKPWQFFCIMAVVAAIDLNSKFS